MLREILRHKSVVKADMAEIDKMVPEVRSGFKRRLAHALEKYGENVSKTCLEGWHMSRKNTAKIRRIRCFQLYSNIFFNMFF